MTQRVGQDATSRVRNDETNALGQIDDVLDAWSVRRRDFHHEQVEAEDERQEFIRHAEGLASSVLRPSLEAIAQRLKACGGDGTLVERPRDAFHGLRLTLWMALDRKIELLDRPDMYPYVGIWTWTWPTGGSPSGRGTGGSNKAPAALLSLGS